MADGFVAVMRLSQREVKEGKKWDETLLAEELERMNRPLPSPSEEAEPAYAKMVGFIEGWSGSVPLAHIRVTPRFERGAGLGCIPAKREVDRGHEVLVNPEVWESILRLDGLEKLDTTGTTAMLAGLPVVEGEDPLLSGAR
jgi:hypothetical protein